MSNSKEKFPEDMVEWINSAYPEYDLKLGLSKVHAPGQLVPPDDSDIKEWKKEKMKEFKTKFGTRLDQVDEWQKRFVRKFLNRKRDIKNAVLKSFPPERQLPVFVLQEPSTTTGRRLFEQKNTDKFSELATQRRDALNQTSRSHAGHWKSIASAAWTELSDMERQEWEENARLADQALNAASDIYKTQENVAYSIYNALHSTIGPKPHQIGCAAYHVLYAYRDTNDELVMGAVQVVDNEYVDVKFDQYFQDYENSVRRTWNNYCTKAVGSNRSSDYAKLFSENENGLYVLPPFDEENGKISDLRQTLKAFLECSWDRVWPRSADMPGLPWSELLENPEEYFHPLLRSGFKPTATFSRPEKLVVPDLRNLSDAIVAFQNNPETNTFSIFQSRGAISHARDQRLTRQEVEKVDAQEPQEVVGPSRSPSPSRSTIPAPSIQRPTSSSAPSSQPSQPNPGHPFPPSEHDFNGQLMPFQVSTLPLSHTAMRYGTNSDSSAESVPPQSTVDPTSLSGPQIPSIAAESSSTWSQSVPALTSASRHRTSAHSVSSTVVTGPTTFTQPSQVHTTPPSPPAFPSVTGSTTELSKKRKRTRVEEAPPEILGERKRKATKKAEGLSYYEDPNDKKGKGSRTKRKKTTKRLKKN